MAIPYPGLRASNVNKDAKYSVVSSRSGGMEVRLIFRVSARERQLLTTDRHDRLVDKVNAVKLEDTGQRGGAFYINEYFDVLVPTVGGGYFFAGTYEKLLEFDMDGTTLSPRAPAGLLPGQPWPGPHAGIKYTLAAGGNDIKYELEDGRRSVEHRLSDYVSAQAAAALAHRLREVKGGAGGGIYINEAGEFFAPIMGSSATDSRGLAYLYLGPLGDDQWFPPPEVERGGD